MTSGPGRRGRRGRSRTVTPGATKHSPSVTEAAAPAQLQPQPPRTEPGVAGGRASRSRAAKRSERDRPPSQRGRRLVATDRRACARSGTGDSTGSIADARQTVPAMHARGPWPKRETTLAQRLLDGDRRALARAISLVENEDPARLGAGARGLSADRQRRGVRVHRTARRRQVDADRRADQGPPRARSARSRVLSIDPSLAVHPGRGARRPHPPDRALPRPGRLHPLDGQPRRARRPAARRRCRRRC